MRDDQDYDDDLSIAEGIAVAVIIGLSFYALVWMAFL